MGFQQELFEVDLERGEGHNDTSGMCVKGAQGSNGNSNAGHMRAENALSYALVLLIAANLVQPTERLGKTLGIAAGILSVVGSVMLVRRQPAATHAKKILVILATVWVLYGVRLVHLGENGRVRMDAATGVLSGNTSTTNGYSNGGLRNRNNGQRNHININNAVEAPPMPMPQPVARILPIRSFNLDDVNIGDEPGGGVDAVDGKL